MLYDRWRQVVASHASATALIEAASGRRWTFKELAAEAERTAVPEGRLVIARGTGIDFLRAVLSAWRTGRTLCPLEGNQQVGFDAGKLPACAQVKTTSGSGGVARHVLFTEAQLAADADQIVSTMGLRSAAPNLGVISLAHSYGFSNLVLPLLLHGVPLIVTAASLPALVQAAARMAPQVTLAAVPALWRAWLEARAIPSNVALAISAGAPLSLLVEETVLRQHGLKIHNFYGSSECGGIAYDRSDVAREDGAMAGNAMDGVSLELSPQGTLIVNSSAAGLGVWPEPDGKLGQGRFETSDLAELKGGQVYLRGRAGDLANIAGRKVAPETVEEALRVHPSVLECVVFSVPDVSHRGERLAACVKTKKVVSGSELARFLSERLPSWQIPKDWWFTDALETNARGKISRSQWRERYLQQAS